MKAIIIEEERFAELVALLRADCNGIDQFTAVLANDLGIPHERLTPLAESIHRRFHMTFVRWAQSHGASCVR